MIVVLGVSSGLMILNAVIIIILLVWIFSWAFQTYRRKRYATVLSQDDFKQGMRKAQVIDLRQENDFKQG
ncbi:MAG: rhodanese-like domain-containing protein, partial [Limosilactobacillus reuteri]|nr:rhodanese-like domain-containing protein [Limosilactobacillus reuteri]